MHGLVGLKCALMDVCDRGVGEGEHLYERAVISGWLPCWQMYKLKHESEFIFSNKAQGRMSLNGLTDFLKNPEN